MDSASSASRMDSTPTLHQRADSIDSALIFIPDISGFTHFVTQTPILHSKDIIGELLETVINTNDLQLEISEIEGDAVLFYRFGPAPSLNELMAQLDRIFDTFEHAIRAYEQSRVCCCQACEMSHQLAIKIIVHYGPVTSMMVGDFAKLLGPAVIVTHRLLKNSIATSQYALLTEDYLKAQPETLALSANTTDGWQYEEMTYEHIGVVPFSYKSFSSSSRQQPPQPSEIQQEGLQPLVSLSISTPMGWTHHVLTDPVLVSAHGSIRNALQQPRRVPRIGSGQTLISPSSQVELRTTANQVGTGRIVYAYEIPSISPGAQAVFELTARDNGCALQVMVDTRASEEIQGILTTYAEQVKLVSEHEYCAEDWKAGVF